MQNGQIDKLADRAPQAAAARLARHLAAPGGPLLRANGAAQERRHAVARDRAAELVGRDSEQGDVGGCDALGEPALPLEAEDRCAGVPSRNVPVNAA